jgi:hypothetical protein
VLTVAEVTAINEVVGLLHEAASGVVQLEGPQEVGGLLEVGSDGVDLVDQVLNANDAVLAQRLLNQGVVSQAGALTVDLAVAALVDELANSLEVGLTTSITHIDNAYFAINVDKSLLLEARSHASTTPHVCSYKTANDCRDATVVTKKTINA